MVNSGGQLTNSTAQAGEKSEHNEEVLVTLLKAGDAQAFRQAVVTYSPRMLATARRIVGNADAEDLVQESWLAAHKQIGGFEGRAQLGSWLCRIVSNRAISALRKRPREQSLNTTHKGETVSDPSSAWFDDTGHWIASPTLWDPGTPEQLVDEQELQRCLDHHLDKMPDNQRQVLMLRDIHGNNFTDICNATHLSASNVRVLLHRGRLKLMAMVDHFQETGTC